VNHALRPVFYGVSAVFALNLFLFFGLGRDFPLPPRNLTIVDATVLVAVANCVLLIVHARRLRSESRTANRDARPLNRDPRPASQRSTVL
jgi:hypothetical protein